MPKLAAIDIGSNAMRLAIASADDDGRIHIIQTDDEAVRLGEDVFTRGEISDAAPCRYYECVPQVSEID